jgi:hypothetical protein
LIWRNVFDQSADKLSHHGPDPGCDVRSFPMSITAPTLSISPKKVCFFIEKAHEFDIADSGANVADEGMIDPTFQELTAFINALTEDEQVDLVALTWLGRGDGNLSDWNDLREEAARLHNNRTAAYLLGNPMLGDHLEEGLAIFGISSEGMQK